MEKLKGEFRERNGWKWINEIKNKTEPAIIPLVDIFEEKGFASGLYSS